jgi:hypothetical protein
VDNVAVCVCVGLVGLRQPSCGQGK